MSEASSTSDVAVMLEQKLEVALRKLSESEEQRAGLRRDLDALRVQLRDVTAQRNRYRRLFEGRCLECNNLSPVHAPDCGHLTGEAAR